MKNPFSLLLALAVLGVAGAWPAAASDIDAVFERSRERTEEEFLPPDEAFRLGVIAEGPDRVRVTWEITEGYYLYRNRLGFRSSSLQATLGRAVLPTGESHEDEYFGRQEIYRGELVVQVPVSRAPGEALPLPLEVTYQGCADAGLCYPPIKKTLDVTLPAGGTGTGFVSEQDRLAALIASGNLLLVLGTFFGLGLLLSLTPCVLPMVPILSGIIAGQGRDLTTGRAFALSLTYVLGMAFTYTLAAAAFAAAGLGLQVQAIFQKPWIVTLFALLFVALALSMFGLYNLQMPVAVQSALAHLSNRQRSGTFGGVAVMGALSALIVTTCIAPPLVATLIVIGQSGDVLRGSAALFSMSLGMGAPLIVVGASAGRLLPKAGPWMDTIKRLFGVLMLAVAVWMLERIVPERWTLLLWSIPLLIGAAVLWSAVRRTTAATVALRTTGAAAALYGFALIAGAALGSTDPLAPLAGLRGGGAAHSDLPFRTVKSVEDLQREIAGATARAQPVMLDFYADWCVSCKEMEKYTFTDEQVQQALGGTLLLRADVTANDAQDQALLRHFGIFGPPTIAFYGADGRERANYRVVGYMKAREFASLSRDALRAP